MLIFILSVCLLLAGYLTYGLFVEKVFGIDEKRITPVHTCCDGVDYVELKPWRIFLIQYLNIAGLGPVFGAILGALYGPVCLLWIIFGSIFAGGVHDFLSGMISLRYRGRTLSYFVEVFLGRKFCFIFLLLLFFLLLLIGSIFAQTPAHMLADIFDMKFVSWLMIVFGYYFLATLLPIDKIVGRFYPLFAACLIISTFLLLFKLFASGMPFYPDLHTLNQHPQHLPIYPLMFITIACGALSGFHATQSPMMSRCLPNEKYGRSIFYGAMILEGVTALVWATLGIAFYHGTPGLFEVLGAGGNAGLVVKGVSKGLLGIWGCGLTVTSVILLTITSGDTALRSARLSCADFFEIDQKNVLKRLLLTSVILAIAIAMAFINLSKLWLYFGWINQMLAAFMLWIGAGYLRQKKRNYWIAVIPALFITSVCGTYFAYAPILLHLDLTCSVMIGLLITVMVTTFFFWPRHKKV